MTVEEQMLMNTLSKECERLHKELQKHKWIPLTKRSMTEEEKKILKDDEAFNCQLPEDRQEILITVDGKTTSDIFYWDDGYCFMEHKYIDDVIAWMPLPEPYQKGEEE